jgi:hypothetical protein
MAEAGTDPRTNVIVVALIHVVDQAWPRSRADGETLVTFEFNAGFDELADWFADESETTRYQRAEWYMYDMYAVYDPSLEVAHYEETYHDPSGYLDVYYVVDVTFNP